MSNEPMPFRRPAVPVAPSRDTQIDDAVWDLIKQSRAERTRQAYKAQWTRFRRWCETAGRQAEPATVETVLSYVAWLTKQPGRGGGPTSPATVELAVAAIRVYHRATRDVLRLRDPRNADWPIPDSTLLTAAIVGYRKKLESEGWQPDVVDGMRSNHLGRILAAIDRTTVKGKRDAAMLLLHRDCFARGAEVSRLQVGHVIDRDDHLEVRLVGSKTGNRAVPVEPDDVNPNMCPVRAWRTWRAALDEQGVALSAPAFPSMHNRVDTWPPSPMQPLSQLGVTARIRRLANNAGLEGRFSAHSLRYGPVEECLEEGADSLAVKQRGGWKSHAFDRYAKRADQRRMNPMSRTARPHPSQEPE